MYNFESLSPKDFEELTRDLLQKDLNISLESFKNGRDQGIDLRFAKNSTNELIVQCKHYKNSTFNNLIFSLKEEVNKVQKLLPKRYIIVTSLSLTPQNKTKILQVCTPYILSTGDIYGLDDLNNLIQKYPKIENDHFKLWMTSTNILERILHSDIVNESVFRLEEITEKIKRFVPNLSLDKAHQILEKENCVVISGAPGVGKTTLAEMLIWEFVIKGYEFVNISENIKEAFSLYSLDPNRKQIFYYDDFLGTTNLTKNEDSRLILFISKVNKSQNKKMILTTREYILQQKKILYEKIDYFDFKKCIIDLKNYTKRIKAEILYSHLYFSELPYEYILALIDNEHYLDIIKHPNYNPRIIDYMTMQKRYKEVLPQSYFSEFIKNLDNPTEIWYHAFENQINNKTRSILFAIVTFPQYYLAFGKDVIQLISNIICQKLYSEKINSLDYKNSIKILDGDFITINQNNIHFADSSIRDFIENYIYKNDLLPSFIELCNRQEQYRWLYNTYFARKKLQKNYAYLFFNKLKKQNSIKHNSNVTELMIRIIETIGNEDLISELQDTFGYILNHESAPYNNEGILSNLRTAFFEDNDIVINFINQILKKIHLDINYLEDLDDYVSIAKFINIWRDLLNEISVQEIIDTINDKFEQLQEDAIDYYEDDLYYLEEAKDKLEEINDKLDLLNDLEDIEEKISELSELEELKSEFQQEYNKSYGHSYRNVLSDIEQEEKNIKNLFNSLDNK